MVQAVLFDMDGVISDTQKMHDGAASDILRKHGVFLSPEEIYTRYAGIRSGEWFTELLRGKNLDISAVLKEKQDSVQKEAEESAAPIEGVVELINKLKDNGFRIAVASSSNRPFIDTILTKLNIADKFDTIASGDEVTYGKPNPEIFLLAARRLQVSPENCLVIEDSRSGMTAAKRAGMACVGLVPNVRAAYPADVLVNSLTELTIRQIREM